MPVTDRIGNRRTLVPPTIEELEKFEEIASKTQETEVKKRRAPGTSDLVTMKISQALYGPLKTIASLTGKTSSKLLDEIVRKGLDEYRNLTIDDLLNK